ncbi:MAG: hypothetical protein IPP71_18300 [Bacteroidetes bacterium]|nr:hypothetical protein [Bacteroidota bacterium]
MIPFNNEPTNDHRITYLIGSAMGVESFHSGINDGTQMANPPPFTLKQNKFEYDAIVESDVPISEEINFKGWNSLTMNNSKLEGISTLNAREVINLHDGFHATQTSEVHIFPAETFAVCNDYTDYTIHFAT